MHQESMKQKTHWESICCVRDEKARLIAYASGRHTSRDHSSVLPCRLHHRLQQRLHIFVIRSGGPKTQDKRRTFDGLHSAICLILRGGWIDADKIV
jgi:hypothetical protein